MHVADLRVRESDNDRKLKSVYSQRVDSCAMGRGSRPKVRWKNERQRKKKAREVRKNPGPPAPTRR